MIERHSNRGPDRPDIYQIVLQGHSSSFWSDWFDGFVAGPNDEVDQIFKWYYSGDTDFRFPGLDMEFKVSRASAEHLLERTKTIGAAVTGRRTFNVTGAWGGKPPGGGPYFVVTHTVPQEWVKPGSPFTFVTDGVESAASKAKRVAGDKDVNIFSANILQQCLKAGLVDEIYIDLAPVLLGKGIPLFEHLGAEPIELENIGVIEGTGVTHSHPHRRRRVSGFKRVRADVMAALLNGIIERKDLRNPLVLLCLWHLWPSRLFVVDQAWVFHGNLLDLAWSEL